jgi:hypothetical protein
MTPVDGDHQALLLRWEIAVAHEQVELFVRRDEEHPRDEEVALAGL